MTSNVIKSIQLTQEQRQRLLEMVFELLPGISYANLNEEEYVLLFQEEFRPRIHWMELCFNYLSQATAEQYAKAHINYTESWALRMILQKLSHDILKHNPIDILYDIWKNPKNYAQDL